MNTFKQSLEEILEKPYQPDEDIDFLPGVPVFVTRLEVACILSVSVNTVDRMITKELLKPNEDGDILKSDLIDYIHSHTLADLPVLEEEG